MSVKRAGDAQLRRRSVGSPGARSVLLTILGEYVLARGEVWQETLVRGLGALGVTPPAARQAIARSTRDGWLETERRGRRARMRLSAGTADLLRRGAERIYGFGTPSQWDGRWLLVVMHVPETRRELRHELRTRLSWAGLGSLGGGLWISPHAAREREIGGALADEVDASVLTFTGTLGDVGDPAGVVASAWSLEDVEVHYHDFLDAFTGVQPSTDEEAFRAQTELVHAWRKFPFLDPDLPGRLLPRGWPRERAYDLFHDRHRQWEKPARRYVDALER